jgi:type VI secretion system secreted protein Hcp
MATIFMRIDGIDTINGAATIGEVGGKKGFFAIDSLSWGAVRGVTVDVGNANNADQGMVGLGELSVSRQSDGASPLLTTFLFSPGAEGKTCEIMITKPSREGNGADPYLVITVEKSRIASYNVGCGDGSLPSESFSLAYATMSLTYYYEDDAGTIQKGDVIKYDVPTATLSSKANLG